MLRHTGLLALALLLGLATAVSALPNFIGPTGLLLVPTADVVGAQQYNAFLYLVESGDSPTYGANGGMSDRVEVGFSRIPNSATIINAKYQIIPQDGRRAGVALGVMDLTDEVDPVLYGVFTAAFNPGDLTDMSNFRFSAGVAGGGDGDSILQLDGFFAGLSFDVFDRATLMAEHTGESFNFGGALRITPNLTAKLGWVGDDHDIVFGASYNATF